jgi:hypothetical protein
MSDESKAALSDKPVNASITNAAMEGSKSMDYRRQLLHSKLNDDG